MREDKILSIDFSELFRKLYANWISVVMLMLISAMISFAVVSEIYVPKYESDATLVVSVRESAKSGVYSNFSTTTTLAGVAQKLLSSDTMKNKICAAAGITDFKGAIEAKVLEETNLLLLSVTDPDPERAFILSNLLIEEHNIVTTGILDNALIQTLESPAMPSSPSNSMHRTVISAFAAFLAFLTVCAVFVVSDYFKDTIKSENDISEKLDARLVATLRHEKKNLRAKSGSKSGKSALLITHPTTSFEYIETIKKIRTRIEYLGAKNGVKTILFTSLLENEGKTTVSANVALALAQKGRRVLLFDADFRRPALFKIFELNPPEDILLHSVINPENGIVPEIFDLKTGPYGLKIFSNKASYPKSGDIIASQNMKEAIACLSEVFDFIIFDTPPMSAVSDAELMSDIVDMSLLVVSQNVAATEDISNCVDILKNSNSQFGGIIFNKAYSSSPIGTYGFSSYSRYGYGYGRKGSRNYGAYGSKKSVDIPNNSKSKKEIL